MKRNLSEMANLFVRKFREDNRGVSSVFLCAMLMGLILLAGLFSDAILRAASASSLDRTAQLAARSMLSEYDRHLFEDYGLFALITDEETAVEKIKMYVDATAEIKRKSGGLDLFGLSQVEVDTDLKSYSLLSPDTIEEQIIHDMKYKIILNALGLPTGTDELKKQLDPYTTLADGGRGKLNELERAAEEGKKKAQEVQTEKEAKGVQTEKEAGTFRDGEETDNATAEKARAKRKFSEIKRQSEAALRNVMKNNGSEKGSGGDGASQNDGNGRTLRNRSLIEALPSREAGLSSSWISKLLGGTDILKNAFSSDNKEFCQFKELTGDLAKGAILNEYILKYCNNRLREGGGKESFFKNEVEYVLYGNLKDADNYAEFKEKFLTLRTGLNLLHIYDDPGKREETLKLASAIAQGPGSAAVQLAIATAWAAAEAAEDLKTIEGKGKVPIFKTSGTWRLSLTGLAESTIDVQGSQREQTGLDYTGYLRLFLAACSREQKLFRMMDLIQINMKGRYYRDFTIKSCYTGFQMRVQCKRRTIGAMPPMGGSSWISAESAHEY